MVAQSVRRKPKELRWDADLFAKVKETPWAPIPGRAVRPEEAEELTEAIEVLPEVPEEPAADAIAADKKEVLRRVYIRQTDLDSHGYTAGCPACDAIRTGYSREGILHSESCRSRVVGKLGESEEGRKRLEATKRSEPPKRFRKAEELKVRAEEKTGTSVVSIPDPPSGAPSSSSSASAAPKRETAEATTQEARPEKKVRGESLKKPRLETGGQSVASTPVPGLAGGQSAASAPGPSPNVGADSGDTDMGESRKRSRETGDEEMVTNFLLSLRTGFLASVAGETHPVCHEKLETEVYEEYETSYWDDIAGKPLRSDLVEASRREEIDVVTSMGVWEIIPRPKGEKVISTRWASVGRCQQEGRSQPEVQESPGGPRAQEEVCGKSL